MGWVAETMKRDRNRPPPIRQITEEPRFGTVAPDGSSLSPTPVWWAHPEWETLFPWLVQGTTGRTPGGGDGNFSLFGDRDSPVPRERWLDLSLALGFSAVRHARQIHSRGILIHRDRTAGLSIGPDADGHLTPRSGILMAVTVADCVPIFLVDSGGRGGGVLHAGWRGVAAGILEAGVAMMADEMEARVDDLFLHMGPAICGDCYEVGAEVHEALGLEVPGRPGPVDLRGLLASRALDLGVSAEQVTRSSHCTRCGGSPFFSHRRGDPQRQVGFLGLRETSE